MAKWWLTIKNIWLIFLLFLGINILRMNHKDRTYCGVLGYFYGILQTSWIFFWLTHDRSSNRWEDLWHPHLLPSRSIYDKWNLSCWTTLFKGHLHSGNTSFFPENAHIIYYLFWRDFFSGERETFSGCQNPGLTSLQFSTPWLKPWGRLQQISRQVNY